MNTKDIAVRQFIQDYLINQIEDIKDSHPYFAFLLMAIGIEFLGKCQNDYDWDDHKDISPSENFKNGLQIAPLKKYVGMDLYDKLRNGLAHALLIKQGVNVSLGDIPNAINCDTFYTDFKEACELVINSTKEPDGKTLTSDGVEIKKNLDAKFFTITEGTNKDGALFSMTAATQSNQVQQAK